MTIVIMTIILVYSQIRPQSTNVVLIRAPRNYIHTI